MKNLCSHFIAEFYDCNEACIDDVERIEKIMTIAAQKSKATVINPFFHQFSPYGITGVIVIAESHFTIHTWPEYNYVAVDLFSCGDFDYMTALNYIMNEINAKKYTVSVMKRGILPSDNGEIQQLELKEIICSNQEEN